MKITLLARLTISYLLLFCMLAGVSLFFIYQLNQFNHVTQSIILNDTMIAEYSNQLSDLLLLESRYDRQFVVLTEDKLFENYLEAKRDFDDLLTKAIRETKSEEIKLLLGTIAAEHKKFNNLVNREKRLIQENRTYPANKFAQDKREKSETILNILYRIKNTNEQQIIAKIIQLSQQSDRATNIAVLISILALVTGLTIAFLITRSIKIPMDLMRKKTVEISRGNFQGDLSIKSPPIIAELANAINTMCQKLGEVDKIKTDFFSHMSHELRTPLSSIKEGTTMLLEGLGGEISEKQRRILTIIIQESNRLIELVNSLLDLSKMEAGMMKYQFQLTDISTLIRQSLETLTPLAEAKNINIDNKIDSVPLIEVDQERMLQVFRNIIGNAIKFTPENGSIKLTAALEKKFVEIQIHDTGLGINEKDLDRIFFKFQQAIPVKSERVKGSGLGLATVKQIILAHGGKVWAKSQVAQGTTFFIYLPLSQ